MLARHRRSTTSSWAFNAIPDRAPTIELVKEPEPQARGGLQLTYKVEDDYGVVDAQALYLAPAKDGTADGCAASAVWASGHRSAACAARMKNGVSQSIKDLTDHPWAGADVTMTLVARDEAGNEGRSQPVELRCRSGCSSSRWRRR